MKTARTFAAVALCLSTLFFAAGCHGGRLQTPSGFGTLESDDTYSYRSESAEGVVLAVRTESNDLKANVDFWTQALDLRLKRKGYSSEGAVTAAHTNGGLSGRQLRYTTDLGGRTQRYWVTVFTTEKKVYVVEAAGDKEAFDGATAMVEDAIKTLKL